ncbi:unnamed protein product [Vitrella brassicaformis CCMP3155]|uniref:EF-hand domain-containing protein n=1 Tax=Vitrella brassicaformis (strain CCMP3155) TaxID=1169540 RepID=A0A0G4G7Q7_VITBC|nr:unnamed protein product [Vitrella brassicaformis CCMP3155]|eukprot:CEM24688.1 unnamed protein product [Vitrella brassicaformis CCMP3155]
MTPVSPSPSASGGPSRTEKFRVAAGTDRAAERIVLHLKSLDVDGDGKFTVDDVVRATRKLFAEKNTNTRLRWVIAVMSAAYVATMAIILGLVVGGFELSKETRVRPGGYLSTKAKPSMPIRVREHLDAFSLYDVFSTPIEDYDSVEAVIIPHNETGSFGYYKVASIINGPASLLISMVLRGTGR